VPAPPEAVPVLAAVLTVRRPWVPADILAGVTLAALAVPQAMGYGKIRRPVRAAAADGGFRSPRVLTPRMVASVIDHLRHTYYPRNSALVKSTSPPGPSSPG
jgi:hypothetical protein